MLSYLFSLIKLSRQNLEKTAQKRRKLKSSFKNKISRADVTVVIIVKWLQSQAHESHD